MTSITCPCCGAAMDAPWAWDRALGVLRTRHGESTHLTSSMVNLLDALIARRGAIMTYGAGVTALYGHCREPGQPEVVLRTMICTLRKAISPTGVRIVTEFGRGYRIVLTPSSTEVAR